MINISRTTKRWIFGSFVLLVVVSGGLYFSSTKTALFKGNFSDIWTAQMNQCSGVGKVFITKETYAELGFQPDDARLDFATLADSGGNACVAQADIDTACKQTLSNTEASYNAVTGACEEKKETVTYTIGISPERFDPTPADGSEAALIFSIDPAAPQNATTRMVISKDNTAVIDKQINAGESSVKWDGQLPGKNGLPAGTYKVELFIDNTAVSENTFEVIADEPATFTLSAVPESFNPAEQGTVNIKFGNNASAPEKTKIKIVNATQRVVFEGEIAQNAEAVSWDGLIDGTAAAAGIYTAEILVNGQSRGIVQFQIQSSAPATLTITPGEENQNRNVNIPAAPNDIVDIGDFTFAANTEGTIRSITLTFSAATPEAKIKSLALKDETNTIISQMTKEQIRDKKATFVLNGASIGKNAQKKLKLIGSFENITAEDSLEMAIIRTEDLDTTFEQIQATFPIPTGRINFTAPPPPPPPAPPTLKISSLLTDNVTLRPQGEIELGRFKFESTEDNIVVSRIKFVKTRESTLKNSQAEYFVLLNDDDEELSSAQEFRGENDRDIAFTLNLPVRKETPETIKLMAQFDAPETGAKLAMELKVDELQTTAERKEAITEKILTGLLTIGDPTAQNGNQTGNQRGTAEEDRTSTEINRIEDEIEDLMRTLLVQQNASRQNLPGLQERITALQEELENARAETEVQAEGNTQTRQRQKVSEQDPNREPPRSVQEFLARESAEERASTSGNLGSAGTQTTQGNRGASTNSNGSVEAVAPTLQSTPRLHSAPERGNTGPGILIYGIILGVAQTAYFLKKQ